jgi:hypothetical protein
MKRKKRTPLLVTASSESDDESDDVFKTPLPESSNEQLVPKKEHHEDEVKMSAPRSSSSSASSSMTTSSVTSTAISSPPEYDLTYSKDRISRLDRVRNGLLNDKKIGSLEFLEHYIQIEQQMKDCLTQQKMELAQQEQKCEQEIFQRCRGLEEQDDGAPRKKVKLLGVDVEKNAKYLAKARREEKRNRDLYVFRMERRPVSQITLPQSHRWLSNRRLKSWMSSNLDEKVINKMSSAEDASSVREWLVNQMCVETREYLTSHHADTSAKLMLQDKTLSLDEISEMVDSMFFNVGADPDLVSNSIGIEDAEIDVIKGEVYFLRKNS